jgi:hypothetical protein
MSELWRRFAVASLCLVVVVGGCTEPSKTNAPPAMQLPELASAAAGSGYVDYRLSPDNQRYQPGEASNHDVVLPTSAEVVTRPVYEPGAGVGMRTIPGGGALALVDANGGDRGMLAVYSGQTLIALDLDGDRRADLTVHIAPNGGPSTLRLRRDASSIAAVTGYLDGSTAWCANAPPAPKSGTVLLACPSRKAASPTVPALIVGRGMRVAGPRPTPSPPRRGSDDGAGPVRVVEAYQTTGPLDLPALELDPVAGGLSLDLRRCTDNATLNRNLHLLLDDGIPAIQAIQRYVEDQNATRELGEQEIVVFGAIATATGGTLAAALAATGAFFIRRAGEEFDRIGRTARRAVEDANREIVEARRAIAEGDKARAVAKIDAAYRILSRAQFSSSRDPAVYGTGFWQEDCHYTHPKSATLPAQSTIITAIHDGVSVSILPNMYRPVGSDTNCASPAAAELRDPNARCIASGIAEPRVVDGGLLVALRHPTNFHNVSDYVLLAPQDLQGYRVLAWSPTNVSQYWPID